jgi:tetratricopeptide (TPR) repeat protein
MAYLWFLKASEKGNASAQNSIGFLYQRGWGVQKDYTLALKWFMKAATENNSNAQNQIGVFFRKGFGVKVNHRTAFEWYAKSAKNGNTAGQCNLAWMYYDGSGTKQDYKKAMQWFLKAAEKNSHDAQYQVGFMYYHGYGLQQADYMTALGFFNLAIENGSKPAMEYKNLISRILDNEKVQVSSNISGDSSHNIQQHTMVPSPPPIPMHYNADLNQQLQKNGYSSNIYNHRKIASVKFPSNSSSSKPYQHQNPSTMHKKSILLGGGLNNNYAANSFDGSNSNNSSSARVNQINNYNKHQSADAFSYNTTAPTSSNRSSA